MDEVFSTLSEKVEHMHAHAIKANSVFFNVACERGKPARKRVLRAWQPDYNTTHCVSAEKFTDNPKIIWYEYCHMKERSGHLLHPLPLSPGGSSKKRSIMKNARKIRTSSQEEFRPFVSLEMWSREALNGVRDQSSGLHWSGVRGYCAALQGSGVRGCSSVLGWKEQLNNRRWVMLIERK